MSPRKAVRIARREVVTQRERCLLADVDLSLAQTADQVGRREIDQFQFIGRIESAVWHRLAYADAGNTRHNVVQAL